MTKRINIKSLVKTILPNKEIRLKINQLLTKKISDEKMLKFLYYLSVGEKLDLENPKKLNEKIQWYKLYYRDDLMTICSDKYLVRDYVKDVGLEHILTPIYGVYEDPNLIEFEKLPDECYIKCTHNSNGNYLWKKSDDIDQDKIIRKFSKMMKNNAYYSSREWGYKNIEPRIICEEYLKPKNNSSLVDFNFFCFNGVPRLVMYNVGLSNEKGEHTLGKRAVLDPEFNPLNVKTSMGELDFNSITKPSNYDQMLEYAKVLSKPFPFVRVDFFYFNEEIRFGELTFYSGGGYGKYTPDEWQYIIGDWFELPFNISDKK